MQVFAIAILTTIAAVPFEAQTLDGRALVGEISKIDSDQVTLGTAGGPTTLEIGELLRLLPAEEPQPPEPPAGQSPVGVELLDGSSVVARRYAVKGDLAEFVLLDGRAVGLPVSAVSAVRLQQTDDSVAGEWLRILAMRLDGDLLVVRKDDVLDYHRGALRDVTEEIVRFQLDTEVMPVKRAKVYGLVYHHPAGGAPAEPICTLSDAAGSRWSVRSLGTTDEGELQWTTPGGAVITGAMKQVVEIDFSRGKLVFLSDLSPQSVVFTPCFGKAGDVPLVGRFMAPRNDTNLQSDPLRLGGEQYAKGLAMHSRTEVVYRLPGRFSRFKAVAGIDDGVRPNGNVRLVISGDGRELLATTLCGTDPPRPIDLDIANVRRITVLVDFGEGLDVADHLDLCNARVIK